MAAWLNLFIFVGYIPVIRIGIGAFAIGSGLFYLKKWWQQRKSCEAIDDAKRGKIMKKLENIAAQETYLLALLGIIALSLAINLVELVCSAGLPAIYTQVLSMSTLSPLSYYAYLLMYVFFFILNQLVVFFVAMFTMRAFAVSTKYARLTNFIGGVLIFILGMLLIFKPAWIMFG
jgi:steroid 5-alpha reductase family enzyme